MGCGIVKFLSRVAVETLQFHGGTSHVNDFDVERFHRDAKSTQIYEGTTEIQKNIVAHELVE